MVQIGPFDPKICHEKYTWSERFEEGAFWVGGVECRTAGPFKTIDRSESPENEEDGDAGGSIVACEEIKLFNFQ